MLSARPNDYGIVFRYQYNKKYWNNQLFSLNFDKI